MKIAKLNEKDLLQHSSEIILLIKQSYKKSFPQQSFEETYFQNRIIQAQSYIKEKKANIYGYIKNNHVVGFIWFFEKDSSLENTLHINHFVVDESHRRLGIGKLLWHEVEMYANERNISEIELVVTKENINAVNFYEKMDFKVNRYVMNKRLG